MKHTKLKSLIIEMYGSQRNFAIENNMFPSAVSGKVRGSLNFTYQDVITWSRILGIAVEDIGAYFFA